MLRVTLAGKGREGDCTENSARGCLDSSGNSLLYASTARKRAFSVQSLRGGVTERSRLLWRLAPAPNRTAHLCTRTAAGHSCAQLGDRDAPVPARSDNVLSRRPTRRACSITPALRSWQRSRHLPAGADRQRFADSVREAARIYSGDTRKPTNAGIRDEIADLLNAAQQRQCAPRIVDRETVPGRMAPLGGAGGTAAHTDARHSRSGAARGGARLSAAALHSAEDSSKGASVRLAGAR
jgi:hypothetical protein